MMRLLNGSGRFLPATSHKILRIASLILCVSVICWHGAFFRELLIANQANIRTVESMILQAGNLGDWPTCDLKKEFPIQFQSVYSYSKSPILLRSQAYAAWSRRQCGVAALIWHQVIEKTSLPRITDRYWLGLVLLAQDPKNETTVQLWAEPQIALFLSRIVDQAHSSGNDKDAYQWADIAERVWLNIQKEYPEEAVMPLRAAAEAAYLQKDWSKAAGLLEKALQQNPNNIELLMRTMQTYDRAGNWSRATELALRDIELRPYRESSYLTLAVYLWRQERYTEAEMWLEQAYHRIPKSWRIPLFQSRLMCMEEDFGRAEEFYELAKNNYIGSSITTDVREPVCLNTRK